ncbi:MAG: GAF domain-containing protein [Calothrix sp. MO_167.B42]|nr:GAF domain-containing protein [Calothrix sp. MO_167.B42]
MSNRPNSNRQFNTLQHAAYQLASCTDQLFEQIDQQHTLNNIIDRIRSSLDLDIVLTTTAKEIRQLLNADRVGVFCFTPGSGWDEGEFVAEDVAPEFPSAMAAKVYDHCFGSQFATYYTQGRVQAVADIYDGELSNCHIQILEQFQVRANLIVPVLKGEELWGLLCIHQCSNPRRWQLSEIEFIQKISGHFAIALQQSDYLQQLQEQATLRAQAQAQEKALIRQKALVKITTRIRQSFEWEIICKTATEEVRQLLELDRVTIYRFNSDWSGDFMFESIANGCQELVGVSPTIKDIYLMETKGGCYANNETFAIPDIYEAEDLDYHVKLLEEFPARAYAIAPIFQDNKLWGLLTGCQNSAPRQWQVDEIELLAQVGEQLGIALKQSQFVQEIQAQSEELKQALQDLETSQIHLIQNEKMASLGQLVAGIAHEINNPVNYIYGNLYHFDQYLTDLLTVINYYRHLEFSPTTNNSKKDLEDIDIDFIVEDLPKIVTSMKSGADRIQNIVQSLRSFSRSDDTQLKEIDIHEGIDNTLLILNHRIVSYGDNYEIQVIKNYGEFANIECYPAQLNQVFMNILTNAIDAIEEAMEHEKLKAANQRTYQEPKIWISTRLIEEDNIEICIRDNGIGIDEKHKSQIFEQFFTTKNISKGTGLGLTISYQIITEKHGGTINLDTNIYGETECVITLPVKMQNQ